METCKKWVAIALQLIALSGVAAYIICMFVIPISDGSWQGVLDTWQTWQSFNAGALAFIASLVAFYVSTNQIRQQRYRRYVAARAFLPEALSELSYYCKESCAVYIKAYKRANNKSDTCKTELEVPLPNLPTDFKVTFSKCIESAIRKDGLVTRLSDILSKLQVHHARMSSLHNEFNENSYVAKAPTTIISYLNCLGELQDLINKTFDVARGIGPLNNSITSLNDLSIAHANLNVDPGFTGDLLAAYNVSKKGND